MTKFCCIGRKEYEKCRQCFKIAKRNENGINHQGILRLAIKLSIVSVKSVHREFSQVENCGGDAPGVVLIRNDINYWETLL